MRSLILVLVLLFGSAAGAIEVGDLTNVSIDIAGTACADSNVFLEGTLTPTKDDGGGKDFVVRIQRDGNGDVVEVEVFDPTSPIHSFLANISDIQARPVSIKWYEASVNIPVVDRKNPTPEELAALTAGKLIKTWV